jgi:ribose transport system permease protein
VLLLVAVILSFASDTFLTGRNLINILFQISVNGIMAIGMTYLFIAKELDLSIGSNMALATTFAIIFIKYGIAAGIAAGLIIGMIVGIVNGIIVTKLKINSIAASLGMMIMLRGWVFFLTESKTIKGTNEVFPVLANGTLFFVPYPVYLFILLLVIFGIILARSVFGRNLYAIGGNQTASEYFGIDVNKNKFFTFLLTGSLAGVSGVVLASRINIASARLGLNTPLDVITAVLLGGTSLLGGEGSIFKTFQGVLLLGVISNALVLLKIEPYYHAVIKGLLLILVLAIDASFVRIREYRFE